MRFFTGKRSGEEEKKEVIDLSKCLCQVKDYEYVEKSVEERAERAAEVKALANDFKVSARVGEHRCPSANPKGGFQMLD